MKRSLIGIVVAGLGIMTAGTLGAIGCSSSSGGSGSGSSSGGALSNFACDVTKSIGGNLVHTCSGYKNVNSEQLSSDQTSCSDLKGNVVSDCPTAGQAGYCVYTLGGQAETTFYYCGESSGGAEVMLCSTQSNGKWTDVNGGWSSCTGGGSSSSSGGKGASTLRPTRTSR